jgi:hypothetical protein
VPSCKVDIHRLSLKNNEEKNAYWTIIYAASALMWFRVIFQSLSYSACLIDISIYPNNLFVKLVSESFYTAVQLATRSIHF